MRTSCWNLAPLALVLLAACGGNAPQQDTLTTDPVADSTQAERLRKTKNIFHNIPSPMETASLLKKAGAGYDKSVLNDVKNVDNYTSASKQALNLGIYGADLSYAGVFNNTQESMLYTACAQNLAKRLDVANAFGQETVDRMEKNRNDRDSLLDIISSTYWDVDAYLKDNGRDNISVDNLDLRPPRVMGGLNEGISGNAPAANTPVNIQVRRCILDGNYAAAIQGAGLLFEDNTAYGWDSCLNMNSTNMRMRRNRCIHIIDPGAPKVGYDPEWDSIITNIPAGISPDEIYIEDNYCDGAGTLKQGIHMMYNPGGPEPTRSGRVIIRRNRIKNSRQAIYCSLSNALIENNIISDVYTVPGFEYLDPGYVQGSGRGISLRASNCTVRGNVMRGNVSDGILLTIDAATGQTLVEHNSAIDVRSGLYASATAAASVVFRNNLVRRSTVIFAPSETRLITTGTNTTLTAANNHYDWEDGSPTFQSNFVDYDMAGWTASIEPTAQSGDPMIGSNGAPQTGSPLILAGTQGVLGGSTDVVGTTRWAPPSIGAFEYVRARPTRTLP